LSSDSATFSALANDVGVECTFSRQVAALGSAQDVIVGISTSGESANVLAALEAGRKAGVLTVALTGYDGGSISRDDLAEYCFVARRQFVPRIQEGHATLWHGLLFTIRQHMVEATQ
jgi:D-sedoheptulose 7-phosphate isomerase